MGLANVLRAWWWRLNAQRYRTLFGVAKVYLVPWEDTRIRVLDLDGTYQSATYIDDRWCDVAFPYLALYDCIFATDRQIRNICMLGGGGYAFPKHVVAHRDTTRIDVVEVDPTITDIARKEFFLDRLESEFKAIESGRLGLVCDDAFSYLTSCVESGRTYDAILNDCFAAGEPEASLVTPRAIHTISRCLPDDGLYLTNIITALEGEQASPLLNLVGVLSDAFAHVSALTCDRVEPDERDNVVVVASNTSLRIEGALPLFDRAH